MPVMTGKELRIVGFLCNWCSYGGADTAGVARFSQPTDLRIVRVPCSGRVNPLFVIKALLDGADGVLVSGCHPRDCHYSEGNYYARRRLETLKEFLPIIGIDARRFEYTWVSASEGQKWRDVVAGFTAQVHELGPAPKWDEIKPSCEVQSGCPAPRRPLGCGAHPALAELKEQIKAVLAAKDGKGPDCVLGWQQGYDPLTTTMLIMEKPEDVDKLVWGPLNVQNLATFLPEYRGRTIGVVVKGCDSKAVVELVQENLIKREEVVIFGMGCNGTVNMRHVREVVGEDAVLTEVHGKGADLHIATAAGKNHVLPMLEIAQDKCRACALPSAACSDHFAGKPTVIPEGAEAETEAVMVLLEGMSLEQRLGFWKGHMERCIRCYACRNACPMCVCRDHCVAGSRDPHWMTQEDTSTQKLFFQLIHAMHLAGRCVACGECGRSCPVGIPLYALKIQINRIVNRLFGYEAGRDIAALPPLLGFEVQERNIQEHHIGGA